ncbi:hypothetical protein ACHAQA_001619 [Verticillium albo-atrum]
MISVTALFSLLGAAHLGLAFILPPGFQLRGLPGDIVIFHSHRSCSTADDECTYSQLVTPGDDTDTKPILCQYKVDGSEKKAIENGATKDFSGTPCREATAMDIVGMWANGDTDTTVVIYQEDGTISWHAFDKEELEWLDITKHVMGPGPAEVDDDIFQRQPDIVRAAPRQSEGSLEYASEWALGNVYRYVTESPDKPGMAIIFTIEHPDFDPVLCIVSYTGKKGDDPQTMSFFDKPCQGNNWGVSWGFNHDADADVATMTLTK